MGEQRDIKPNTFVCLALAGRGQGFEAWPSIAISPGVAVPSSGCPPSRGWKIPEDVRDEQLRDEQLSCLFPTFPLCLNPHLSPRPAPQSAQPRRSQEYNANS